MDELSALPPDVQWKRAPRIRTSSLMSPQRAFANLSPTTTRRTESPETPGPGLKPTTHPDHLNILAPTPRRHLLESSASKHWLHTPPLSPVSSRGVSPQHTFGSSSSLQSHARFLTHHRSFSALLQQEQDDATSSPGGHPGSARLIGKTQEPQETAMGRRWIRWMHKRGMKELVVPGVIAVSVLVRLVMGLASYSGWNTPPMFGDFEAQRHWMEITLHLPIRQWYTYDLQYWGLDYPPLTAYVSWLCGSIAHWIEPQWVALNQSRGIETPASKLFMRLTVVVLELLVYIPALVMFARVWQGSRSKRTQELALLTLLLQPALLLIDHGHFQYNSVMLGLTLFAMNFFATGQDLLGAFCFVLSLGFKQMGLYYAPAIGSYLLAKCLYLGPTAGGKLFIRLAVVTSLSFTLLFLPFLPPFSPLSIVLHPISRIFPFSRGLFEDKVANFWCASNVVFRWKHWASTNFLLKLSALLTALGFLPSVVVLLRAGITLYMALNDDSTQRKEKQSHTPFLPLLPYALLTSSLSFFLFSFQVHEKSILLALMPITLLLSGAPVDSPVYSWGVLVNNVAVFSMWPLLKKDGLAVQYIATLLLWNRIIGYNPVRLPPKSFIQFISMAVYASAIALHVLEWVITPPARYPDLIAMLNVLISTPVFVVAWLWSIKCGIEVGWALGGLGGERKPTDEKVTVVKGSYRQVGGRAVSLGYAQSRRREAGRSRASSVVADAVS